MSRKDSSKRKSDSPSEVSEFSVSAFFRPAIPEASQPPSLSGGDETRLQQMRMELGRVVSRRVELLSKEEKLTKSIKRLSRAMAKKQEQKVHERQTVIAPSVEETSSETLFSRRHKEGSENEFPPLSESTNQRWKSASLEAPGLVDELAASHRLAIDPDTDNTCHEKENRHALSAMDKLKALAKESSEPALEEGLESMYAILSSDDWASPSIDTRLNRILRRCAHDISELDVQGDRSESVRLMFLWLTQLSVKGADDGFEWEGSRNPEEVKHWLILDEKPNTEIHASTSSHDIYCSNTPLSSSDDINQTLTEIPSLHLDISIPESPSSRNTAIKSSTKTAKQVIVDLTISPESVPSEFREGSDSQRLGSIPSSISNGLVQDDTLPEGCFVYDPDIVETYEVPGKRRKFFNDVSMVNEVEQALQPIPEEDEGDEEVQQDIEYPLPEQPPSIPSLPCHVQAASHLTLKDLDRMMRGGSEPDFPALNEADLRLAAKRYGLKNMRRSALVKVLQSIWRNQRIPIDEPAVSRPDLEAPELSQGQEKSALDVEAIVTYIRESWDLYEKVLTFQPIDLDELHGTMASKGLAISKPKLRSILDEHNVFLTYGQQNQAGATSRKRKAHLSTR